MKAAYPRAGKLGNRFSPAQAKQILAAAQRDALRAATKTAGYKAGIGVREVAKQAADRALLASAKTFRFSARSSEPDQLGLQPGEGAAPAIDESEDTLLRNVSVCSEGEARGHGLFVDGQTLRELEMEIRRKRRVPVKLNHNTKLDAVIGWLESARVVGTRLLGNLRLLASSNYFSFVRDLIGALGGTIGLSPAFSGISEKGADGTLRARVKELHSVDLVEQPAANPAGLFSTAIGANHFEFSAISRRARSKSISMEAARAAARGIAFSTGLLSTSIL
jgi:hypothetical protein